MMANLTIPQVRACLLTLAAALRSGDASPEAAADDIEGLVVHLHRRKAIRKAPVKQAGLTKKMAHAIRLFAEANPEVNYQEMATVFETNIGRVSEALAGKRE